VGLRSPIGDDAGAHGAADVGTDVAGSASADVTADSGADRRCRLGCGRRWLRERGRRCRLGCGRRCGGFGEDARRRRRGGGFGEDAGDGGDGGDGGGACSPAPTLPVFAGTPTLQFVVGTQVSTLAGSDVAASSTGRGRPRASTIPVSIAVG